MMVVALRDHNDSASLSLSPNKFVLSFRPASYVAGLNTH